MRELLTDLADLEKKALALHARCDTPAIRKTFERLIKESNDAERAHSGSWIGRQSCVYYNDLDQPPPDAYFDKQWGLMDRYSSGTVGDWVQYNFQVIYDHFRGIGTTTKPTLAELEELFKQVARESDDLREELVSVVEACRAAGSDDYLERLKNEANSARMTAPDTLTQKCMPRGQQLTIDISAVAGGPQVPPHVAFRSYVQSIRSCFNTAETIAKVAKRAEVYLRRRAKVGAMLKCEAARGLVFIGHGRSKAWLELQSYIQDRLNLKCDHFNREAVAGKTTIDRLSKMLDDACFALVVLTGEDEQKDGKLNARMNVVHEVGLFQGRLGFEKAIVVLEDGCEQFSNIHGLTHIPFEKDRIKGTFAEIADTLKREGIIA